MRSRQRRARIAAKVQLARKYHRLTRRKAVEALGVRGAVCDRPFAMRRDQLARANRRVDRMLGALARTLRLERVEFGEGLLEFRDRNIARGIEGSRSMRRGGIGVAGCVSRIKPLQDVVSRRIGGKPEYLAKLSQKFFHVAFLVTGRRDRGQVKIWIVGESSG